jgi:hypothetical protein
LLRRDIAAPQDSSKTDNFSVGFCENLIGDFVALGEQRAKRRAAPARLQPLSPG